MPHPSGASIASLHRTSATLEAHPVEIPRKQAISAVAYRLLMTRACVELTPNHVERGNEPNPKDFRLAAGCDYCERGVERIRTSGRPRDQSRHAQAYSCDHAILL